MPFGPPPLIIRMAAVDLAYAKVGLVMSDIIVWDEVGTVVEIMPLRMTTLSTEKTKHKQIRASSDEIRRAVELTTGISRFVAPAQVMAVELPHASQSASAALGLGIAKGVIAALSVLAKPMIAVSADDTRKAAAGRAKQVSKAQVIEWAAALYPDLPWIPAAKTARHASPWSTDLNEHMADAVATLHAAVVTDDFRQLVTAARMVAGRDRHLADPASQNLLGGFA